VARDDEETADVDDAPAETDEETDAPRRSRRSLIDGRTLAICVLIAFIAAAATYLAVSALTDDDGPTGDDAAEDAEPATLTRAEKVPSVALERYDGTGVSPADYEGQPLVMNFWASWCVPCTEEMPDFQQVHESLGEDVAFLGVNVRDDEEAGRAMVERTGVTYDVARDTSGDLARELGITNLPVTVIVAPDGTVLDTLHAQVSPARLCEVVNQQLMGQSLGEGDCG
jgi:cytochrome c biogenesis protein CcmG/thiol:disulfide interchange protein DsbE